MSDIKVSKVQKHDNGQYLVQIKPANTPKGTLTGAQPHYFESRKEARDFRKAAIMLDKTPEQDEVQIGKKRFNKRRTVSVAGATAANLGAIVGLGALVTSKYAPKNMYTIAALSFAIPLLTTVLGFKAGSALVPKGKPVEKA